MQVQITKSRFHLLQPLQLAGAVIALLLGIAMFLQILIPDVSRVPNIRLSDYISLASLLIGPPLFLLLGSYIQLRHRRLWAVILLVVAGLFDLIFVGFNMGFTFMFVPDKLGQIEVLADVIVLISTLVLAIGNTTINRRIEA